MSLMINHKMQNCPLNIHVLLFFFTIFNLRLWISDHRVSYKECNYCSIYFAAKSAALFSLSKYKGRQADGFVILNTTEVCGVFSHSISSWSVFIQHTVHCYSLSIWRRSLHSNESVNSSWMQPTIRQVPHASNALLLNYLMVDIQLKSTSFQCLSSS